MEFSCAEDRLQSCFNVSHMIPSCGGAASLAFLSASPFAVSKKYISFPLYKENCRDTAVTAAKGKTVTE